LEEVIAGQLQKLASLSVPRQWMCLQPQHTSCDGRIYSSCFPPTRFITAAMHFAMMAAIRQYREEAAGCGLTMASDRQIAANRRNARRSNGPRSAAGTTRSSRNSFRHGLAAGVTTSAERTQHIEQLARKIAGGQP
jgi:hypothetical protein